MDVERLLEEGVPYLFTEAPRLVEVKE